MPVLRNILELFFLFWIFHAVQFFNFFGDNQIGFWESCPKSLFVFVYVGFLPIILSLVGMRALRKLFPRIRTRPVWGDAIFICLFLLLVFLTFSIYVQLGMLAA